MGNQKSPGFSRFGGDQRNLKEIFYLQPNLFIQDTEDFLGKIQGEIDKLNEKSGRKTPTQKKFKSELDYQKEKQIQDLEESNEDVVKKMETLMILTKQVTQKMKSEGSIHPSPRFRLAKAGGDPLHDLDVEIFKNYEEIKKLQQEKTDIVMKFEVNQKDHSKYVTLNNEIKDTERQLKVLDDYYNRLVKMIEGTRDLIQKNTEDSGKEQKVLDIRNMIHEVKIEAKDLENESKKVKKNGDKAFDKVMKANEEQKALKREVQFLKGNAGGIADKKQMDDAMQQKKKNDRVEDIKDTIKKRHMEIMMREKVHHQKYVEQVQRAKQLSMQSVATTKKIQEMDEENNLMWEEIKQMSALIGERSSLNNLSTHDRQSYRTD